MWMVRRSRCGFKRKSLLRESLNDFGLYILGFAHGSAIRLKGNPRLFSNNPETIGCYRTLSVSFTTQEVCSGYLLLHPRSLCFSSLDAIIFAVGSIPTLNILATHLVMYLKICPRPSFATRCFSDYRFHFFRRFPGYLMDSCLC
jgi:hypothetical protein